MYREHFSRKLATLLVTSDPYIRDISIKYSKNNLKIIDYPKELKYSSEMEI